MRFVIRAIGLAVFAAAFIALIADGIRSLAAGYLVLTTSETVWMALHPSSLAAFRAFVEHWTDPYVWNGLVRVVLAWPAFAVAGLVGVGLLLVGSGGRRRALEV